MMSQSPIHAPVHRYAINFIKNKWIFPYAFIPAKAEVDYLPNPLKLIQDKISTQIKWDNDKKQAAGMMNPRGLFIINLAEK